MGSTEPATHGTRHKSEVERPQGLANPYGEVPANPEAGDAYHRLLLLHPTVLHTHNYSEPEIE